MLGQILLLTCLPVGLAMGSTARSQDGVPGADPPASFSFRIVEEGTDTPIPGATVQRVYEALYPTWGKFEEMASAVADGDGRVTFEGESHSWFVVIAEGFGVRGELKVWDGAVIGMTREVPITVEVVDFTGRPVPLVHLGVAVGCGHTPDVISATTGPDGRALIRGAAPGEGIVDLYPVHPELVRDQYARVPFDEMNEDGVAQLRVLPGSALEGQVLFADGSPAAGVGVGLPARHRGPWTTTDENGTFTLFGLPTRPDYLEVKSQFGTFLGFFEDSRAGCWRTLRLEGTAADDQRDTDLWLARTQDPPVGELVVSARHPGGEPAAHVPVEVWDPATGACFRGATDELGLTTLELPVGPVYRVEAGGPGSPFPTQGLGQLDLGAEGLPRSLDVTVPEPRLVSIRLLGIHRLDHVVLTRADGSESEFAREAINSLAEDGDGAEITVDQVTLPSGRWGISLWREQRRPPRPRFEFPRAIRDLGDTIEVDFRGE